MREVNTLWAHSRECILACGYVFFGSSSHEHSAVICHCTIVGGGSLPEIVTTDESSNECRRWMLVHSLWVTQLLDMSVEHDGDAI